jgi:putative serine protease PepD
MVEDDRSRSGGVDPDLPGDYHYYGPYDQRPENPLGIGSWSADDDPEWGSGSEDEQTQILPPTRPSFEHPAPTYVAAAFPAPAGVPALRPRPPEQPEQLVANYPPPRRPMRGAAVIAIAALTALVIGGSAGFAGSRLADRTSAQPADSSTSAPAAPSTDPAPSPSASRTSVPPAPRSIDAVEVAKTALPSTVMIRVGAATGGSIGSGFVLDRTGLIMTNNHVVAAAADGAKIRVVFSDGAEANASVVGRTPTYDLAVIKVRASNSLVPIKIGDSDATQVGESVIAIGAPLALAGTVTEGIVSAKNRPVAVGGNDEPDAYINSTQTDAPINPGNSGGPLLDAGARVIGINSAILTLSETRTQAGNIGLGFAIPINQAMDIAQMLIKDGKATYPVIGADVKDPEDYVGVVLTNVAARGPADKAGLRKGDVVLSLDGKPVNAIEQLIVAVREHRPGDVVTLVFKRGAAKKDAQVTLIGREG